MNKKLISTMLSLVTMLSFAMPAFATPMTVLTPEQPACSSEMIRYFDYNGYHVKEHKWYCVYNSDFYTVKFYSENSRLLGWQIFKNYQLISTKDFTSVKDVQLPLCSGEMNRYFDYQGHHVKEHGWNCVYDNDSYKINVYSEGNLLLGWQIFKNSQLTSFKSFI
jgi:hypothetical protein